MGVIKSIVKVIVGIFLLAVGIGIFIATKSAVEHTDAKMDRARTGQAKPATAPKSAAVPEPVRQGGAWRASTTEDTMTGKKGYSVRMPATDPSKDKYGRPFLAELVVRCDNAETAVMVNTNQFISTHEVPVMHKIDGAAPVTTTWAVSTDYEAVFAPKAVALVKAMKDGKDFRARFTPHGESPTEFHFDITGLDFHVVELRKACGW